MVVMRLLCNARPLWLALFLSLFWVFPLSLPLSLLLSLPLSLTLSLSVSKIFNSSARQIRSCWPVADLPAPLDTDIQPAAKGLCALFLSCLLARVLLFLACFAGRPPWLSSSWNLVRTCPWPSCAALPTVSRLRWSVSWFPAFVCCWLHCAPARASLCPCRPSLEPRTNQEPPERLRATSRRSPRTSTVSSPRHKKTSNCASTHRLCATAAANLIFKFRRRSTDRCSQRTVIRPRRYAQNVHDKVLFRCNQDTRTTALLAEGSSLRCPASYCWQYFGRDVVPKPRPAHTEHSEGQDDQSSLVRVGQFLDNSTTHPPLKHGQLHFPESRNKTESTDCQHAVTERTTETFTGRPDLRSENCDSCNFKFKKICILDILKIVHLFQEAAR